MPSIDLQHVLVLVPALNEQATIERVVGQLRTLGFVVLVVDDGSSDSTAEIARKAGAVVVRLPFNLGVGAALRCGFRWAIENGFEIVVQCDADGQHDPAQIVDLVRHAEVTESHLVIGTRFSSSSGYESTPIRRIPMWLMARIASHATREKITDSSSGFRLIREPLLTAFSSSYPMHYLGDTFEALVDAGRRGFKVSEVKISMRERQGGIPSASTMRSVGYLVRSLISVVIGSAHNGGFRNLKNVALEREVVR